MNLPTKTPSCPLAREHKRPNLTARSLRTSVTATIALISDTIATEPYAGEVIHGALDAALEAEHLLLIAETEGSQETAARVAEAMLDHQVDGFVFATFFTREAVPPSVLRGRPVVLLNCLAEGFPAPSVIPDERAAGRAAAQCLLDAGHRRDIHVIGGHHYVPETPSGVFAGRERMEASKPLSARPGSPWPESSCATGSPKTATGRCGPC